VLLASDDGGWSRTVMGAIGLWRAGLRLRAELLPGMGSGRTQPGGLQRADTNLFHLTAPVAR
jgi:hypothetical protein